MGGGAGKVISPEIWAGKGEAKGFWASAGAQTSAKIAVVKLRQVEIGRPCKRKKGGSSVDVECDMMIPKHTLLGYVLYPRWVYQAGIGVAIGNSSEIHHVA